MSICDSLDTIVAFSRSLKICCGFFDTGKLVSFYHIFLYFYFKENLKMKRPQTKFVVEVSNSGIVEVTIVKKSLGDDITETVSVCDKTLLTLLELYNKAQEQSSSKQSLRDLIKINEDKARNKILRIKAETEAKSRKILEAMNAEEQEEQENSEELIERVNDRA